MVNRFSNFKFLLWTELKVWTISDDEVLIPRQFNVPELSALSFSSNSSWNGEFTYSWIKKLWANVFLVFDIYITFSLQVQLHILTPFEFVYQLPIKINPWPRPWPSLELVTDHSGNALLSAQEGARAFSLRTRRSTHRQGKRCHVTVLCHWWVSPLWRRR